MNATTLPEARCSQRTAASVMAASGKTFFQAARLLPRDVRDSVIHLYAFCRYIDDLADESTESVANRSKQLEQLQQILVSNENGKPIYEGAALVSSLNLSPASRWAASVLVGAAREDLRQKQPETEADLISYAFGVAGTVGLMMAEVLGARKEGTRAAVELGIAMQLSNIARDVAQDLRAGRIYLPTCWLTSRDIELALDQQAEQSQKLLVGSTLRLLTLADAFYDSAFSGIWTLPWRMRWSILAAALCYREIGIQVGKDIKASWQSRTIVPRWRKLTLIATAGLRLLLPRYWKVQARGRYSRQTKLPEQLPLESTLAEALSG